VILFYKAIRGVAGLLGFAIKTFACIHLIIDVLYGGVLALLCFWIAADGSVVRGTIAAVLAVLMAIVVGMLVGLNLTIVMTIGRAVRQAAVGKLVFDQIFVHAMGVTDEQPEGARALTQKLHALPVREVEATLQRAADAMLAEQLEDVRLAGLFFWLARRMQRVVIWVTIRVVVRECASGRGDDAMVDLLVVRDRLAGTIDEQIIGMLREQSFRLVWALMGAVFVVALMLAWLISWLPF
jgi:hypothetical protein